MTPEDFDYEYDKNDDFAALENFVKNQTSDPDDSTQEEPAVKDPVPAPEEPATKDPDPVPAPVRKATPRKSAVKAPKKAPAPAKDKQVVYLPKDAYFALLQYKARARQRGGAFQSMGDILEAAVYDLIKKNDKDLYDALQISK